MHIIEIGYIEEMHDEIKKLLERENRVGRIYHVGLTVPDLDRSIAFYRDILGLEFQGEIFMKGEGTDKMFRRANCKARVAYLNASKAIEAPIIHVLCHIVSVYFLEVYQVTWHL